MGQLAELRAAETGNPVLDWPAPATENPYRQTDPRLCQSPCQPVVERQYGCEESRPSTGSDTRR